MSPHNAVAAVARTRESKRGNWIGVKTLFWKEVRRFLRVPGQTLLSPLITTSLYFIVFGLSLGHRLEQVSGIPYGRFIVPGLVTLGVITNGFLNTSSSFFIMKIQGTLVDLLVSPLSYGEIIFSFVAAAVVRALMVGTLQWVVAGCFVGFQLEHPLGTLLLLVLIAVLFGVTGLIASIWAEKFEQANFVPTFVITPLTFLGGVFYSANGLPGVLRTVALWNPIFYLVDAVRFAMLGVSDAPFWKGATLVVCLTVAATSLCYGMLRSGYKLRR